MPQTITAEQAYRILERYEADLRKPQQPVNFSAEDMEAILSYFLETDVRKASKENLLRAFFGLLFREDIIEGAYRAWSSEELFLTNNGNEPEEGK
ncbi:MAG: hypothetical protein ACK5XN_04640 [Bacteroidota bacterium]|jgi:hypothetical protein